jgi:hypothetical protein
MRPRIVAVVEILERLMRVLIVIALLIGAAFMILYLLTDLARELSRHSFQAPPDLDNGDDWDAERQAVSQYPIEGMRRDRIPGSSNALDDLRSAL